MSGLDINTPRGQETLKQEGQLAYLFEATYPGRFYAHTPKDKPAGVDGLIINEISLPPFIEAVVESKCRNMSMDDLAKQFRSEWLVTFSKLTDGRAVADFLRVPFYGFLYLVPDDVLLTKKIYDPAIGWLARFRVERTLTQATVNGGDAIRANAYIDMSDATVVRRKVAA